MRKSLCFYSVRAVNLRRWRSVVSQPHMCNVAWQYHWQQGNKVDISIGLDEYVSLPATPVWQNLVENIQQAAKNTNDIKSWCRFCRLWRTYFPKVTMDSLPIMLEKEILSSGNENNNNDVTTTERVPRDLHCLPVFLQALSTAVQLGETRLQLFYLATGEGNNTKKEEEEENVELLASVMTEIRVVVFYLAQTRLTHTLYATHYELAKRAYTEIEKNTKKDIILKDDSFSSRDEERVSHMGMRLTSEEMQQALVLFDTSAALLAIDPPVVLLPTLYRLLLPAVSACEQLDNHRLGALAIAMARSADFRSPNDNNGVDPVNMCTIATEKNNTSHEALRSTMTSYTVLSHLHAIARVVEVRMREVMESSKGKGSKLHHSPTRDAQMRLLSLKERKALEKRQGMASKKVNTASDFTVDMSLLKTVAVVCSALAARRYVDDSFWNSVMEFTVFVVQASISPVDLLQDVRDVLFALDYVHQKAHFDCIMTLLVKLRLLQEPIAPPSATRDVMKVIKGQTAAAFN